MYCPECGSKNPDDAVMCVACDAPLTPSHEQGADLEEGSKDTSDDAEAPATTEDKDTAYPRRRGDIKVPEVDADTADDAPQASHDADADEADRDVDAQDEADADTDAQDTQDAPDDGDADAQEPQEEPEAEVEPVAEVEAEPEVEGDASEDEPGDASGKDEPTTPEAVEAPTTKTQVEVRVNAYEQVQRNRLPVVLGAIGIACVLGIGAWNLWLKPTARTSNVMSGTEEGALMVSFDPGWADAGAMSPIYVSPGSTVTAPKCGFMRGAHEFMGWMTSDGRMWQPGSKLVVHGNIVLTAKWDFDLYPVRFVTDEGEGHMDERLVVRGSLFTLPPCAFIWDGHEFSGWQGPDGRVLSAGSEVICTGNMEYRAAWDLDPASVEHVKLLTEAEPTPPAAEPETRALPAVWNGTYEGRSDSAPGGIALRNMELTITAQDPSGAFQGTVSVGVGQEAETGVRGSYNVEGAVNWETNEVSLRGTSWIDQGGMSAMGAFSGIVDTNAWTLSGQWTDVDGVSGPGAWSMTAQV